MLDKKWKRIFLSIDYKKVLTNLREILTDKEDDEMPRK